MTVIKPNAIAGINSITVASGAALAIHKADGTLIQTLSGAAGVSTFTSISVGSAATSNSAAKSINIGLGASISQHTDNSLTFGTAGDPVAKFDASGQLLLGTGTARQKLHINASDSGAANMVFTNTTTGTSAGDGFIIGISGAEDAQINMQETANLKFSTADTERFRIDSNGRLIIGHTASTGEARYFQLVGTTADTASAQLIRHSADSSSSQIDLTKSRNATKGSNTIVQDDDVLGQITFRGDDGTDLNSAGASISASVDGTPGSNDMPGRLVFSTTADGSNSATERLRITSAGDILIGNTLGGAEAINMVGGGGGILISRSESGVPNDGQTLGDIGLNSYASSQTCSSADVLIRGQADGNHSGSSAGSALLLFTKPASTGPGSAPTERLRVNKSGAIGIAGANYGSAGQVLTSNGSGSAVSWATASAGIEMAQHFRLTSSSQGNQTPLTNWEAADNSFAGSLGSSMSVSSGVFTYPSTGIYFCLYTLVGYSDSSTQNLIGYIEQTINGGSNWGNVAYGLNGIYDFSNSYPSWANTATHYIFDVTDTAQQKTRFRYGAGQGPEYVKGDTNITYTGVTFIRLGDT